MRMGPLLRAVILADIVVGVGSVWPAPSMLQLSTRRWWQSLILVKSGAGGVSHGKAPAVARDRAGARSARVEGANQTHAGRLVERDRAAVDPPDHDVHAIECGDVGRRDIRDIADLYQRTWQRGQIRGWPHHVQASIPRGRVSDGYPDVVAVVDRAAIGDGGGDRQCFDRAGR